MTLAQKDITLIGVAAAAFAAVALAAANFSGTEENGGGLEYAITLGASLLVALALFGWGIPRAERPARSGLIVGLVAVLSLAAFWSGLPYVLGPAAVVLGLRGRTRSDGGMQATAAIVLGALAVIGGIAAVVLDRAI